MLDQSTGKRAGRETAETTRTAETAETAIQKELDLHARQERKESYLSAWVLDKGIDLFCPDGRDSLTKLSRLAADMRKKEENGDASAARADTAEARRLIDIDRRQLAMREQIGHCAADLLKTTVLFMKGGRAVAGTALIYALDQCRPSERAGTQCVDFALGSFKGLAMHGLFDALGKENCKAGRFFSQMRTTGIALRGVLLGAASRLIDRGLTRETYQSADSELNWTTVKNGLFSLETDVANRHALMADGAIFLSGHLLFGTLNAASRQALEQNPLWKTALAGTSFGMTAGAYAEIGRQSNSGAAFDPWKVAECSLIQGLLGTVAAMPGGAQAARELKTSRGGEPSSNSLPGVVDNLRAESIVPPGAGSKASRLQVEEVGDRATPASANQPGQAPASEVNWELLNRFSRRFSGYEKDTIPFMVATDNFGPFEDYTQFLKQGQESVDLPMRLYDVKGHPATKLALDANESQEFATLKALKFLSENAHAIDLTKYTESKRARLQSYIDGAKRITEHQLYDRLPPELAVRLLDEAPDSRVVSKLTLMSRRHWVENWFRQEHNSKARVYGQALPDYPEDGDGPARSGEVRMFLPGEYKAARNTFLHEYAHVLEELYPEESELFAESEEIEPASGLMDDDAVIDQHELWAKMLGEGILCGDDPVLTFQTVQSNPIHTAILGRVLEKVMAGVPESLRSTNYDRYARITKYIREDVTDVARGVLRQNLESLDDSTRQASQKILDYLDR